MKARSWKAAETRFARDVGSDRNPCDGSRDQADFHDGFACYQLKVRRRLPAWLWTWLIGIQDHAIARGKVGVLVLKKPCQEDADALVIVSWQTWIDLHGRSETRGDATLIRPHGNGVTVRTGNSNE